MDISKPTSNPFLLRPFLIIPIRIYAAINDDPTNHIHQGISQSVRLCKSKKWRTDTA